jgi:hypothetical protein
MEHKPILQTGAEGMTMRYVHHKPFMVKFPDKSEMSNRFNPDLKGETVCYMDRSKTNKGTGAGVYGWGTRRHSFSLGSHTIVVQAEIHAIKPCIIKNIEKSYTGRNNSVLSDSQTAINS